MYTTVEKVKLQLARVRDNNHIHFNENAIKEIAVKSPDGKRYSQNEDISVDYEQIDVSTDWQGHVQVLFVFTSPTTFDYFEIGRVDDRKLLLGSGDIASTILIQNDLITFPANIIGGTIVPGSEILFKFLCHVSDILIEEYIFQAETLINLRLRANNVTVTGDEDELEVLATYWAAYSLYMDTFYDKYCTDSGCQLFIKRWKDLADELLDALVDAQKKKLTAIPTVSSLSPSIRKIGIPGVGRGMKGRTRDPNERNLDDGYEETFFDLGD